MKRSQIRLLSYIALLLTMNGCSDGSALRAAHDRACASLPKLTSVHPIIKKLDDNSDGVVIFNNQDKKTDPTTNIAFVRNIEMIEGSGGSRYNFELWKTEIDVLYKESFVTVANGLNYIYKEQFIDTEVANECFSGHPIKIFIEYRK